MDASKRKHALRDLREIDVDNLASARITDYALMVAVNRCCEGVEFSVDDLEGHRRITSYSHILLADELNDMLEAAREQQEHDARMDDQTFPE